MNGIPTLVLFDLGATRSFVSLALRKRFFGSPSELDHPLEVEITNDRSVQASMVHRGCVLRMLS